MTGVDTTDDTTFFQDIQSQTMALLHDIRDFIASGDMKRDSADIEPNQRMQVAADMSRLTSRATGAMSLVLLYQAIEDRQTDDITDIPGQLAELWQVVSDGVVPASVGGPMPPAMALLVQRGDQLFLRMDRLRTMIEGRL